MKSSLSFVVIILSVFQFGFAQNLTDSNIYSVSAREFNKLISTGNYILLDIRTPKEFEEGHISTAINIDFFGREFEQSIEIYKNVPVLLYSRSSGQSKQALDKMLGMHFKKVIELENGIVAWKREGLPLVN